MSMFSPSSYSFSISSTINFFSRSCFINLVMITVLVGYLMFMLFFNKYVNWFLLHGLHWTILPAIILLFIAFPSLRLLYLLDEPSVTLKTIGHQWYWSYE